MSSVPDPPVSLSPGLFVVGTDTGVGKTAVASALLRLAQRAGRSFVPFKPVETGCAPHAIDARSLWLAAGQPVPAEQVVLYAFPLPAAPAVAAGAVGACIDLEAIVQRAFALRTRGSGLIVEGAGGLLVPYRDRLTSADLAHRLQLPVLVVARAALGTINHTALTVNEIRRRALPLAGVILVETTPDSHHPILDNLRQIETVCAVRPLGGLPFVDRGSPDLLADALLAAVGPKTISDLLAGQSAG